MPIDRQHSSTAWQHNARQDFPDKQMDLRCGEAFADDPFVKQEAVGRRTFGVVALDANSLKHASGLLWPGGRQPLIPGICGFFRAAGRPNKRAIEARRRTRLGPRSLGACHDAVLLPIRFPIAISGKQFGRC
jgi:hypothetical protein